MEWTSDNEEIATVDYKGKITGKSKGKTTIHLNIRGKTKDIIVEISDPTEKPIEIPITGVTLNQTSLDFNNKNQTFTLEATITPNDTTQNKKVTWSSSNTDVATVDENGKVTSKSAGTTVITARTSNGLTATCRVNIITPFIPITNVTLNKTSIEIEEGKTETLIATILPENHTDSSQLTWSSSNTNVATVDENGKVTSKSAGTTVITARTSNGLTTTCRVNIITLFIPITNVTLNKTSIEIEEGKTETLIATILPENHTDISQLIWSSSNTDVATVDSTGKITAVSEGTAVITAKTSNGLTATCRVNIIVPFIPITNVTLNKTNIEIEEGKTETLIATILPENHTDSSQLTWSSNNTNVVTVDENGKITAVSAGTTIITAKTSNGKTATCTVTVTNSKEEEIKPDKPEKPDKPTTIKLGDVNKDGKIDVFDARVILRKAASRQEFTVYEKQAGDVNKDKAVNVLDARRILMYSAKIISKF